MRRPHQDFHDLLLPAPLSAPDLSHYLLPLDRHHNGLFDRYPRAQPVRLRPDFRRLEPVAGFPVQVHHHAGVLPRLGSM